MLYSVKETAKKLDELVEDDKPFYFVRFGDGDLHLMIGHSHEQRHKNSGELQKELTEALVIKDDRYVVSDTAGSFNDGSGSYWWVPKSTQQAMDNDLKRIRNHFRPNESFYHALVFQYQIKHNPDWFINFCRKAFHGKKVLFLAGDALCEQKLVRKTFNVNEEIVFPGLSDAYYHLDKGMNVILEAVERNDVVLPVIGMASRVLAKRLWENGYRNKYLIDVGVSVDALACADHRGWTKKFIEAGGLQPYKEAFL